MIDFNDKPYNTYKAYHWAIIKAFINLCKLFYNLFYKIYIT